MLQKFTKLLMVLMLMVLNLNDANAKVADSNKNLPSKLNYFFPTLHDNTIFIDFQGLCCGNPTITTTGSSSICVGGSITLTSSYPNGNQWYKDGALIFGATGQNFVATSGGTYKVILYDNGNYYPSNDFIVTVNQNPTVSPIIGVNTLCTGQNSNFTNSTSGGVWSSDDTNIATVNSSGLVTGLNPGTTNINYTVTNSNGCSTKVSQTVTVYQSPNPSPIVGPSNICIGNPVTLTSSPSGGVWQSDNIAVATVSSNGLVTGVSVGSALICYTITNSNGCSKKVTKTVYVYTNPIVGPISGVSSICVGSTTQYYNNSPSGGVWSSNNSSIASINSNGLITAHAAGTATISYTVTNSTSGCSTTVTKNITINANPIVLSISGSSTVCEGTATQFLNSTPNGVWSSDNTSIATVNNNGDVFGVSAGTTNINYTVTNGSTNCSTKVSKSITVNPRPIVANNTGVFEVCVANTTTLSNATLNGSWSSSNSNIATVSPDLNNNGIVTGVNPGSVSINYTVTDHLGCSTTKSDMVTVYANPVVANIVGPNSLCAGKNTTMSNATPNGSWSSSNTSVATINSNGVVQALQQGNTTITYTVINSNNCTTSVTKSLDVYDNPIVNTITGPTSVCVGKIITLQNTTANGVWSSSNGSLATVNNNGEVYGVSVGEVTITYTVTNSNGCATSVSKIIDVYPNPVVQPIVGVGGLCVGQNHTYSSTTNGGTWSSTNTTVASIDPNTGVLQANSAGTTVVEYTVTNSNGCSTTESKIVQVYANPVVSNTQGPNQVCVNNTITLTNTTSGGVWSSSNPGVATVNSSGVITGVSAGTVVINYTVTNSNNCTTIVPFNITVHANPLVAPIQGDADKCVGLTANVTNATANGTWASSNTNVATINQSGVITTITAGVTTISYSVTNSNNCTTIVTKQFTVHPKPIVTPIVGPITMCVGQTTTLTNITPNGSWGSSNSSRGTIDNNGLVTALTPGYVTYSYFVTNLYGCTTVESIVVQNFANPVVDPITGSNSVCESKTIQLNSNTTGGVWSTSDASIATVSSTGIVTGVYQGSVVISYTVTNSNGCSTTQTKNITVNPNPVLNPIGGPSVVCVSKTITLVCTNNTGTWSSSDNSIATINSNGVLTGLNAGTVTITYTETNSFNCSTSVTKTVTVNPNPVVDPITGPSTVCVGNTIQLNCNSSTGSWSSSNTTIATVNTNGLVTAIAAGSVTISYTVVNSFNCSTTVTKQITVYNNPVVGPITCSPSPNVCVNSTLQLNNSTSGGTWSSGNTTIATIDQNGLLTGVAPGTVTISYSVTNTNNCTTVVTHNVTVKPNPIVNPISGVSSLCVGQNASFSSSTLGGVWSSSNTAVATVSSTGSLTAISSGNVSINYTVTNTSTGCSTTVSKVLTVYDNPIVAPLTGPSSVCVGETITFGCVTPGGVWCTSNPNIADISTSGVVTGYLPGIVTISYKVTNANGCTTTVSQTVTVYANPAVSPLSGPSSVCIGNTITLNCSTSNGVWSSSNTAVATVNNGVVTGLSAGTTIISYQVTNANGCTTTVTKEITVNPNPVVTPISGPNTVCVGKTIQLNCISGSGTWSSSNPAVASISNGGIVTGNAAGTATISYTVTNSFGCSTIVTYDITVYANPNLGPITCSPSPNVCIGSTLQLYNSTAGGTWTSSNTYVATVNASGVLTGNAHGTTVISYTVTNSHGCTSTVTHTVNVNPLPPISPIYGSTSVCVGNTIVLNCGTLYGQWSSSNNAIATVSSNGVVTGISGGTVNITYTVTNSFGCTSSTSLTISVIPMPAHVTIVAGGPTQFCHGGSVTLYSNCGTGNQWYKNGVPIPGATGNSYVATTTGNYYVVVGNNAGCSVTSNSIYVYAKFVGSSAIYHKFCGPCNYTFRGVTYIAAGTYYVHVPCAIGCDSIVTLFLIDTCGYVSGGGGGGIESKTLGDVISKRLYGKAVNSIAEVNGYGNSTKFSQSGVIVNGPNDLTLNALVPASVDQTNAAYISTPSDIINFTNAVEILAVDYTKDNITKAVAFGTKTLGDVYNHTKPICDRLKGAELLDVKNLTVRGYQLMAYQIKQRTGEIEYAVNLSAGTTANRNTISLQSNWFTDNYQPDETLYNFQLWAVSYDMVTAMADDIIGKLINSAGVNSVTSADLPKAYISKGNRKATDLTLTFKNNTAHTSGYFELEEKVNENASTSKRKIPFTITANGVTTLTLPVKDYYEGSIYVYLNNNLTDLVYLADGTWNLDYDKTTTTINKFNVVNELNFSSDAEEYRLMRNVEMQGSAKNYITIYKTMMGGGLEEDVTAFKNMLFKAKVSGAGRINVTFVKKSISKWSDQYNYTLPIDGRNGDYVINFNQLKSAKFNTPIVADDITAVSFSFINNSGVATPISVDMSKVRFTNQDVTGEIKVYPIAIFPNPSNGKFVTRFTSEVETNGQMKIYEASTGKLIKTQYVNTRKGENQVSVNLTEDQTLTSGVYIITLEGEELRYAPTKLVLTK